MATGTTTAKYQRQEASKLKNHSNTHNSKSSSHKKDNMGKNNKNLRAQPRG
jgi:hypothetical protein